MNSSLPFSLLLSLKQLANKNNKTNNNKKSLNIYSFSKQIGILQENIIVMRKISSLCRQKGLEYTWSLVSRVQRLQLWCGSWRSMDRVALSWKKQFFGLLQNTPDVEQIWHKSHAWPS